MMRFILGLIFSFFCMSLTAQPSRDVLHIEHDISAIRQNLDSYLKIVQDRWADSCQGGSREGYFKGKDIQMLALNNFDNTGIKRVEYYFKNKKLIYVVQDHFEFDFEKIIMKEEKLYFHDRKLVKWVDAENKEISPDSDVFKTVNSKVFEVVENLVFAMRGE